MDGQRVHIAQRRGPYTYATQTHDSSFCLLISLVDNPRIVTSFLFYFSRYFGHPINSNTYELGKTQGGRERGTTCGPDLKCPHKSSTVSVLFYPSSCKAQPHWCAVAKLTRSQLSKEKEKRSDQIVFYRYHILYHFSRGIRSGSRIMIIYRFKYGYTRSRIWNKNMADSGGTKINCIPA
jgi:hypothetical protein